MILSYTLALTVHFIKKLEHDCLDPSSSHHSWFRLVLTIRYHWCASDFHSTLTSRRLPCYAVNSFLCISYVLPLLDLIKPSTSSRNSQKFRRSSNKHSMISSLFYGLPILCIFSYVLYLDVSRLYQSPVASVSQDRDRLRCRPSMSSIAM